MHRYMVARLASLSTHPSTWLRLTTAFRIHSRQCFSPAHYLLATPKAAEAKPTNRERPLRGTAMNKKLLFEQPFSVRLTFLAAVLFSCSTEGRGGREGDGANKGEGAGAGGIQTDGPTNPDGSVNTAGSAGDGGSINAGGSGGGTGGGNSGGAATAGFAGDGLPDSLEENCTNGLDDNRNMLVDCEDPACIGGTQCSVPETDCANGTDDDGDGRVDCLDSDCGATSTCAREDCSNGTDDDGDSRVDCLDSDCDWAPGCEGLENCENGVDDDGDGWAVVNVPNPRHSGDCRLMVISVATG